MVSFQLMVIAPLINRVWFILVVLFNSVVYADYSLVRGLWSGGGLLIILLFLVFW